jgi:hypothetical protein
VVQCCFLEYVVSDTPKVRKVVMLNSPKRRKQLARRRGVTCKKSWVLRSTALRTQKKKISGGCVMCQTEGMERSEYGIYGIFVKVMISIVLSSETSRVIVKITYLLAICFSSDNLLRL